MAHSTAQCQARGFSATSIRASQRPQRSVHRSARVPRPVTKLGVPLSSPGASHIRKEPDKLVGWEVLLEQGGARSGQVQSILGGPLSSTLLRVYGPGWGRSATQILPDSELGDSGNNGNAIHLIPLAEGIVHRVDVEGRRLFIKPPEVGPFECLLSGGQLPRPCTHASRSPGPDDRMLMLLRNRHRVCWSSAREECSWSGSTPSWRSWRQRWRTPGTFRPGGGPTCPRGSS